MGEITNSEHCLILAYPLTGQNDQWLVNVSIIMMVLKVMKLVSIVLPVPGSIAVTFYTQVTMRPVYLT